MPATGYYATLTPEQLHRVRVGRARWWWYRTIGGLGNIDFPATDIVLGESASIADAGSDTGHGTGVHFHSAENPANQTPPTIPLANRLEVGGLLDSEECRAVCQIPLAGLETATAARIQLKVADVSALQPNNPGGLYTQPAYIGPINVYGFEADGVEETAKYATPAGSLIATFTVEPGVQVDDSYAFLITSFYNAAIAAGWSHIGLRFRLEPASTAEFATTFYDCELAVAIPVVPPAPTPALTGWGFTQQPFATYFQDEARTLAGGDIRPIQPGRARSFNGVDQALDFPAAINYTNGTYSFWFNKADISGNKILVADKIAGNNSIQEAYPTGSIVVNANATSFSFNTPNLTFEIGQWNHVAVTKSGDQFRVYFNGIESSSGVQTLDSSFLLERFGEFFGGGLSFNGMLAGIAIYDRVLTLDEVIWVYSKGQRGTDPTVTNLTHGFHCEANTDGNEFDYSGNGNDLVAINSPTSVTHGGLRFAASGIRPYDDSHVRIGDAGGGTTIGWDPAQDFTVKFTVPYLPPGYWDSQSDGNGTVFSINDLASIACNAVGQWSFLFGGTSNGTNSWRNRAVSQWNAGNPICEFEFQWDSGTTTLTVLCNGELVDTEVLAGAILSSSATSKIGARSNNNADWIAPIYRFEHNQTNTAWSFTYEMDDDSFPLVDTGSNNYDGVQVGTIGFTRPDYNVANRVGHTQVGVHLDGNDQYIRRDIGATLANQAVFTQFVRFRLDSFPTTNAQYTLFAESTSSDASARVSLAIRNTGGSSIDLRFAYRDAPNDPSGSAVVVEALGVAIVLGKTHSASIVYDSDNNIQKVYFDGQLLETANNVAAAIGSSAAVDLNIGIFRQSAPVNDLIGTVWDFRSYLDALSDAEVLDIHDSAAGQRVDVNEWLRINEMTGEPQDASGNGYNGTLVNGATWSQTIIPRDESAPTKDATGGALQYSGDAPKNAPLLQSNGLQFNGIDQDLNLPHLSGSETVTSSGGTSTPTVVAGGVTMSAGTCWDLLLSDGTRIPMSEGSGNTYHTVDGTTNHASGINTPTWVEQDEFHYGINNGFRLDGAVLIPARADGSAAADGNPITNPAVIIHDGSETLVDFTAGQPDDPEINGLSIPDAYPFATPLPITMGKRVVDVDKREDQYIVKKL